MPIFKWSRTAASNGTADSTCPFPEGMSPSAVNDGVRGAMAAVAAYRDDIAGAIVTGGSSTAYTVASYSGYDTLAHLDGQMIAFTPHATNGATATTLNVDSLGAKPLRSSPGVELLAGTLILGTPYVATYNNANSEFYLQGFVGNPYNVPLGAGMDFWGTTAPNSSFAFPTGQQISQTTYATLYALFGSNRYGTDAGGNFFLPDKTGRVSAMKEASATRLTSSYFGGNSANMGAVGGLESETLTLGQLPTGITVTGTVTSTPSGGGTIPIADATVTGIALTAGGSAIGPQTSSGTFHGVTSVAGTANLTSNNTSGNAHNVVQPTIVCNYIIRII